MAAADGKETADLWGRVVANENNVMTGRYAHSDIRNDLGGGIVGRTRIITIMLEAIALPIAIGDFRGDEVTARREHLKVVIDIGVRCPVEFDIQIADFCTDGRSLRVCRQQCLVDHRPGPFLRRPSACRPR